MYVDRNSNMKYDEDLDDFISPIYDLTFEATLDVCCGLAAEVGDLDFLDEACLVDETRDKHYPFNLSAWTETCIIKDENEIKNYRLGFEDQGYPLFTEKSHVDEELRV